MSRIPAINPLSIAPFAGDPGSGAAVSPSERIAVENLISAYSYNWDSRDADATASLFTEDAKVAFFLNGADEASNRTTGHEPLLEAMKVRTQLLKRWRVETRHLMLNTVMGPTRDGLIQTMTTATIFWQQLPDHPAPICAQSGYYRSSCVDTSSGWKFQHRETHLSGVFHPRHFYEMPD